jgi:HlyD family secretion protein
MSNRRPPLAVIVIVLLAAVSALVYFFYYLPRSTQAASAPLSASGTVEATEIKIASETAGKVVEVLVNEGDPVQAGDKLFRLDGSLLEAQRKAAAAALDTARSAVDTANAAVASAQAQYDSSLSTALAEEKATRTADWQLAKPTDFNQPSWYFNRGEQFQVVQDQMAAAQTALDAAQKNLQYIEENTTSRSFLDAEKRLLAARSVYQAAQTVLDRSSNAVDGQDLKDEAQTALDDAKSELDSAQRVYDDALTGDSATKVLQARAKLAVAQESYDTNQDRLRALQTGLLSPKVAAAQKAVDQASAAAAQAKVAVGQAEANLNLIDTQIQKLSVTAPEDGLILTRGVEPGEVVNPGAALLSMARISELTITVFLPEDRYGAIKLGQAARVTVDSFAGETFSASVINISERAEFTPRNVQTVDGRKTTVFAIKLRVQNPDGKLKYGMPADVTFE